jgi:hypothetical protein
VFKNLTLICGLALVGMLTYASERTYSQGQAAGEGKTTYLVFYRSWDTTAQTVGQAVKTHAEKHAAKATWAAVSITDPAQKALVDKYQVGRAPMPLVLGVHPNGAITGVFQKPMTEAEFVQTSSRSR